MQSIKLSLFSLRLTNVFLLILCITGGLFTAEIAAQTQLEEFSAGYDLYHNGMFVGKTERSLEINDDKFTFTSIAKTAGLAAVFFDVTINETSELYLKNNHLHFQSYRFNEIKNDESKSYHFRLEGKDSLYNSYINKNLPVADNLQDASGFTVAVMQELLSGNQNIRYTIAEKKKLKPYFLKFVAKEVINTDHGPIQTIKIEHFDDKKNKRITLWCAEKMGFLPIRINIINDKGDENLLNLNHFNNKPLALELEDEDSE
ncbi:MAG: DUF3108 domain-containing protein [Woeseiaceae bacterium]